MDNTFHNSRDWSIIFQRRFQPRRQNSTATSAIPTAGATGIEGTVVDRVIGGRALGQKHVRIGHPGGVIEMGTQLERQGDGYRYAEAILGRTARRLMEGYVLVPEKHIKP